MSTLYGTVWCSIFCFAILSTQANMNILPDCNVFNKGEELSVVLNNDVIKNNYIYVSTKNHRSRYDKFVVGHSCIHVRDREPSRIPVKKIKCILNKSRKIRCLLRSYIRRQVPQSSHMHSYISNGHARIMTEHYKSKLKKHYMKWIFGNRKYGKSIKCKVKLARNNLNPVCLIKGIVHDKGNYKSSVYKNVNHRVNHTNCILSSDVETNPGPIDSTRTIQAPYCQDNVVLFGLNAGTQCVAMPLTSLIFGISSSMDLIQIMNIGNELY